MKVIIGYAWLYLGSLTPETSEEDIEKYLRENGVSCKVSCRMISNTDYRRAFKIGIPMKDLDKVYEETFWPTNVICRPFRAPRSYRGTQ